MERVAIIGNSGGGKSMLARQLAAKFALPYIEIDSILWLPGWQLVPAATHQSEHSKLIAQDRWLIDGLGARDSISLTARARNRSSPGRHATVGTFLARGRQASAVGSGTASTPSRCHLRRSPDARPIQDHLGSRPRVDAANSLIGGVRRETRQAHFQSELGRRAGWLPFPS